MSLVCTLVMKSIIQYKLSAKSLCSLRGFIIIIITIIKNKFISLVKFAIWITFL